MELRVKKQEDIEAQVYRIIREMIVNRKFAPGQRIIQEEVANMLGVSRTPVKRAITQLINEHLIIQKKGYYYVNSLDYNELASIYEIRAVLEGLACRMAAPKAGKTWCDYMKKLFEDAKNDPDKYYKADIEFHTSIPKLANNPILTQVLDSFRILTISFSSGLIRKLKETFPEHIQIIDALVSHNEELAETLGREHIRKSVYILKGKAEKDLVIKK